MRRRVEHLDLERYASNMNVGVRELKSRLAHYLRLVRQGERIVVCVRGVPVAELRAARRVRKPRETEEQILARLEAEGVITHGRRPVWKKPFRPLRWRGKKSLSEMIIEDRR